MTPASPVPRLARIQIHPIKSLDPVQVQETAIGPAGSLQFDRAWALYHLDGTLLAFSRTPALHRIRASYSPDFSSVTLQASPNGRQVPAAATFAFPGDTTGAAAWFSEYFKEPLMVRYDPNGRPDDLIANGPTILSTASLDTVCEWYPGLSIEEARLRFRATLEVDGVPPFWEDRLFGPELRSVIRFRIADVAFEGSYPCIRCPVPPRDPRTGEDMVGFQKTFVRRRRELLPDWSHADRFEHFYCLATNTRVASTEAGKPLRLGDTLTL